MALLVIMSLYGRGDLHPSKYKSNCVVKETYGGHIQVRNVEARSGKHLSPEEIEKIEKEREEKRKFEIKRREEYLSKLFEREAKEREERLRRAREENAYLKEQARASMFATLEKSRVGNMGVDIENNRSNLEPYESAHSLSRPIEIVLNSNFEGFKTAKGISISNLGIMLLSEEESQNLGEKGDMS
ncbi:hypothetical protein [Borrelia hermsii]|uniref:Uncharacterized protein n=2 Tax=Borrelia hermsii TaxID=140 RepID=A0AAN0X7V9_BORHE|nr:hypothetical protein [Borrelia hermsii]AMR76118.1 hypothetical protein A0V01_05855 [Borrelia hermsii]ANA44023.1 PF-62-like protein [Borrelia hermsii HS1]UPA08644.1 hypothetical protein bhDAH_001341 [Borrelia hermsii DAH]